MSEMLSFNLKRNTVAVVLETETGPANYQLIEMSAAARDAYLDTVSTRMTIVGGQPQIRKFEGHQADLLTRCMVREDNTVTPAKEVPVSAKEVQAWPAGVVSSLFNKAQALNHLDTAAKKAKEDDAKKE